MGEGAGWRGPGSLRGASSQGDRAAWLAGRAGGEGSGPWSWGVWLLVGLAGLCEAQLCPELGAVFATTTDVAAPAGEGGGGWRALRRSVANRKPGLHWGAFPLLGPHPEGSWGW